MPSDNLDIVIKARGGRQAAAEARQVEQAFEGIGKTVGKTTVQIDSNEKATRRQSSAFLASAATALKLSATFGAVAAAGLALRSGFNFVSTVEQNQVAFEQFLGSAKAARDEITALQALGKEIPAFGFDTFATNAKKLLAMGTPLKRVNKDLKTMAETALGLGLGSEGIDRIALAIGQMRSTGVVQGDELRQLQEAGIKVYDYMIQAGIITRENIGKIGDMHIDAATAIDAIMAGMQKDFGGLSKRASKTWAFQLGALKTNAAQAAGALVQPIVAFAESDVLPKLTKFFQDSATYLKAGGAQQIYDVLGKLTPAIAAATGAWLAYKVAVLSVIAAQKVGAFFALIGALIALVPLVFAAATGTGTWAAAWAALDVAVDANAIVVAITAIIVAISALITLFAKSEGARNGLLAFFGALWKILKGIGSAIKAVYEFGQGFGNGKNSPFNQFDIPGIPFMAGGGTIPVGGMAVTGEAGAELLHNRGSKGVEVTPLGGGAPQTRTLQPIYVALDSRVLAEAMAEVGMTSAARA